MTEGWEPVVRDLRLYSSDAMTTVEADYLYVTANQSHPKGRYHDGQDERKGSTL